MEINHKYLHFGPVLAGTSVDPKLTKELLERGKNTVDGSHVNQLAGHLETENTFSNDDIIWFADNFKEYFIPYFTKLQKKGKDFYYGMKSFNRVLLSRLWVNYMKKNEFNPPHTHSGAFSFVLYADVPKEISEERKEFKGTGLGPGTVTFFYGEDQKGIITAHGIGPQTNDLWMFPAVLKHMVPPFKSDATRISISGNFFITDKLNQGVPLQPGEFLLNTNNKENNAKV